MTDRSSNQATLPQSSASAPGHTATPITTPRGDVPEKSDVPNAAKVVQANLGAVLTIDQDPAILITGGVHLD